MKTIERHKMVNVLGAFRDYLSGKLFHDLNYDERLNLNIDRAKREIESVFWDKVRVNEKHRQI